MRGREAGGIRDEYVKWSYKNLDFRCPGIQAQNARVKAITDKDTQQTCNILSA